MSVAIRRRASRDLPWPYARAGLLSLLVLVLAVLAAAPPVSAQTPVVQFKQGVNDSTGFAYNFSEALRKMGDIDPLVVSPAPAADITVTLSHTAGTATAGTSCSTAGVDYVPPTSVTVAAGATKSARFAVELCHDRIVENDETLTLSIASGTGYTVGKRATSAVSISDRTFKVNLSASPNPVSEGSSVTVTANRKSQEEGGVGPVTIPLTLTAGTAEPGDYGALSGIMIAGGDTTGTGMITTAVDADTANETFTVALNTANLPIGHTAGDTASVTVQINDNGVAGPTVSLSAAPNPVGEGADVTVTATLSKAHTANVTIPLTLTAGTAETGDFGTLSGITVSSGATSGTGTISANQDTDADDETFTVALGTLPPAVGRGSTTSLTVTIADDDKPSVSLSAAPNPVGEGADVTVTATLSKAHPSNVTIPLTVSTASPNTAESGDVGTLSGIAITAGQTSGTGTISTNKDTDENDETFTVALGTLPGSVLAGTTNSVTVTIEDAGSATLTASPNPVREGANVTVTVTLSKMHAANLTIPLTLTAGTAETGDHGTLASITVAAGQTSGTGTISANQDADADDETFTVALGTLPASVTAGTTNSVTVTIADDDKPSVSLSASPNPVGEGADVTVTVTLSKMHAENLTIPLTVSTADPNTAESGDVGTLASITVAAGQTSGTGTISTNQDTDENDETFTVALGTLPATVTAGTTNSLTVTITDAGSATLTASPNPVREGADVTVTVTLSKAHTANLTIPLTLTANTAESGDYGTLASITVAAGQTSGTGTISANQDADLDHETFTVALGTLPASVTAGTTNSLTVTITDDDVPSVSLSVSPNPVSEGTDVTVTVTLSKAHTANLTIPLTLTANTAEPTDYGTLSGVAITAGQTSGTGTISTNKDTDTEDETFTVALGTLPASVGPGSTTSVMVTISDVGVLEATLTSSTLLPVEGHRVRLTATISKPAPAGGITVYFFFEGRGDSAAVAGVDFTFDPPGTANKTADIVIPEGSRRATATLSVVDDGEREDDETIWVTVIGPQLSTDPTMPGHPWLELTIPENAGSTVTTPTTPTVRLSVTPNPVDEGNPATVTATLSAALSNGVTIPLELVLGSAETGDYGSLSGIAIDSGSTSGTGTISTNQDSDTEDETFFVALGILPSSVSAGRPTSVRVTIRDDDPPGDDPPGDDPPGGDPPPQPPGGDSPPPQPPGGDPPGGDPPGGDPPGGDPPGGDPPGGDPPGGDPPGGDPPGGGGDGVPPVNVAPEAVADTARTIEDAEVVIDVLANDTDADGDALSIEAVTAPENGTARIADGGVLYAPAADWHGTDRFGYTAADGNGGTAQAEVVVVVVPVNDAPVAVADTARTVEDAEVVIDVLANDTDADGDALSIEAVTAPVNGTARIADGGVLYAPAAEWQGTDRFRYTVADGNGGTAQAEVVVVVKPENDAPVAVADSTRTAEDAEIVIDVLANDTDTDGDALRIESVTAPVNGTARIADGGVLYAPAADWNGTDRFGYTVIDGRGGKDEAEVVVVVEPVNDAPVAMADSTRTAEDAEVVIDVLANDTDTDGDALRIESVTAPEYGTARIADGGVLYAPAADWNGTDRFRYTVIDGNGGTAQNEVVVVVEPVNDAPVAMADSTRTAEDAEVVIDVLANDIDTDGDALRIESVTAPENGTARIADGRVLYAPAADWHGTDRFRYTAADGNGGTAQAEVVVVVDPEGDPPVAVGAITEQSLDEGGAAAALDLNLYFKDPDGDALTYYAVSSAPGLATVAVAGATLTVTPVGYGRASVEVTARDPGGLEARQAFFVGVSDQTVRMVLDETLAAMARAHVASARMTLNRRAHPRGATAGSMLRVMGRRVPLNRAAALQAATRMLERWALSQRLRDGGLRNAVVPGGSTEWMFAFGDQEERARAGAAWRFWGQGDIQTFTGPTVANRGFEGDLRSGWAGIDRALGARWLLGVAVSRSTGGGDWRAGSADGLLYTSLTAVHPYLNWSDGASSVWAMAGGGLGLAENSRGTGRRAGESELRLGLGAFEARHNFASWFGFRTDAAWARLETGEGTESVDGRSATVDQQRLGIALSPSSRHVGLALDASVRRDGGAGQTGTGLEVAGGLRIAGGPVRIDAQGRILAQHSVDGYEERGLGVTVSIGRQAAGEGLSLSVSPRWGGPSLATGVLWREQLASHRPSGYGSVEAWSLDAEARYGMRLPGGRLLNWAGSFDRSIYGWSVTVGVGIGVGTGGTGGPGQPRTPDGRLAKARVTKYDKPGLRDGIGRR